MSDFSKLNGYDVKDAQARADLITLLGSHALAALGSAAWLGADATVTEGATGVATTAAVKNYVDSAVAGAFLAVASETIFEDKNKGKIA